MKSTILKLLKKNYQKKPICCRSHQTFKVVQKTKHPTLETQLNTLVMTPNSTLILKLTKITIVPIVCVTLPTKANIL
jgi:hypothetical protein